MPGNSESVLTKQQRIANMAERSPSMSFTSLAYLMDIEWLKTAFYRTRRDGAPGVDGQTAREYEEQLEDNLQSLLDRVQSGAYRAPPVRRVQIPKGTGSETRPIGIPTLEDKVLQRAVVMLLEPIYEHDFYECSYGFRPQRSAHQALETVWRETMNRPVSWILEVDIRKFFDTLNHAHLRELLRHRVRDGVLLRLIDKWLKAGVMEDGQVFYPEEGTPQGGVISPLLANVLLHYVLDDWFAREVQPRLAGHAALIRYADDFVIAFTHEADARRVAAVLPQRFERFGLTLHPQKTRLVPFRRPPPAESKDAARRDEGPGTFDFLGFTHYWKRSRRGRWTVARKTASSRLSRAIKKITQWCRAHRHDPLSQQQKTLSQKLRGHYAYYGITGNALSLAWYYQAVRHGWRKWLSRRNRERRCSWTTFAAILQRHWLPPPRVVHTVFRSSQPAT